jgi:phenylalanine-4-hydroxylase
MKTQGFRRFTDSDHQTWGRLYRGLADNRAQQAAPLFSEGLEQLGIGPSHIPELDAVNRKLEPLTGWKGVAVEGYEDGESFYPALARREYPIGNFIRDARDISYTPAPDVFHDLYGHLPFFANRRYADFCAEYGRLAARHLGNPSRLRLYERFFWFTVEFALIDTSAGRRIFGAGLLSSKGESDYALGTRPHVAPFDIGTIVRQEFQIDRFQDRLFVLKDEEQLYGCLDQLEAVIARERV